jgi:hypothetical protein
MGRSGQDTEVAEGTEKSTFTGGAEERRRAEDDLLTYFAGNDPRAPLASVPPLLL